MTRLHRSALLLLLASSASGCEPGPLQARLNYPGPGLPYDDVQRRLASGADQLGWKHHAREAPDCAMDFNDSNPTGLSREKMAYSFSVCYMPSKPNSFFYVDCETQLAADGKGNVYPVERSQFEASCRRDAETLLAAAGFGTDGRVLSRVRASDARGGKLVCQKGAERMEINVPPGALSGVLPLVQKAGYAESDCDFVPSQ